MNLIRFILPFFCSIMCDSVTGQAADLLLDFKFSPSWSKLGLFCSKSEENIIQAYSWLVFTEADGISNHPLRCEPLFWGSFWKGQMASGHDWGCSVIFRLSAAHLSLSGCNRDPTRSCNCCCLFLKTCFCLVFWGECSFSQMQQLKRW